MVLTWHCWIILHCWIRLGIQRGKALAYYYRTHSNISDNLRSCWIAMSASLQCIIQLAKKERERDWISINKINATRQAIVTCSPGCHVMTFHAHCLVITEYLTDLAQSAWQNLITKFNNTYGRRPRPKTERPKMPMSSRSLSRLSRQSKSQRRIRMTTREKTTRRTSDGED